jgi:hypothetical protein
MNTISINKKSTSLRLNLGLYAHIEKLAKKQNRSINNYIETLLFDAVGYHEPNAKTKKAIEEARAEKKSGTLKKYTNADDLFNDVENGI